MTTYDINRNWDYDVFVVAYNAVAQEHDGTPYNPEGEDREMLALKYTTGTYNSLQDFAYARFYRDQRE
jgi:hypothetical protein